MPWPPEFSAATASDFSHHSDVRALMLSYPLCPQRAEIPFPTQEPARNTSDSLRFSF